MPGADAVDIIGLQIPASGTWTSVLADDGGLLDWADWASRTGRPVAQITSAERPVPLHYSYVVEPLDETTLEIVRQDLRKVIAYDPRVQLIDMTVQAAPDNNMIIAFVDLLYLELDVKETLKLEFSTAS